MHREPTVSVIVPLYQTRPYVAATLDSLLAQTFEDFEVIVLDDGSTDGGDEIARSYAARDSRFTYLRQENAGLAATRNAAIAVARGTYIGFLDSDDLWLPDKLERQVPLARAGTILHGDAYVLRDDGQVGGERLRDHIEPLGPGDQFDALLAGNPIAVLTVLAPRELVVRSGGFDASLRSAEDYDLWLRLAAGGASFEYIPEPLAVYRIRAGSLSSDPVWMASHTLKVYAKLERTNRSRAVHARVRKERRLLAGELRRRGWDAVAEGSIAEGRRDLARSVRAAPGWWKSWRLVPFLALPFGLRPLEAKRKRRAAKLGQAGRV